MVGWVVKGLTSLLGSYYKRASPAILRMSPWRLWSCNLNYIVVGLYFSTKITRDASGNSAVRLRCFSLGRRGGRNVFDGVRRVGWLSVVVIPQLLTSACVFVPSMRCQSILNMAMFRCKKDIAIKYSRTLNEHFFKTSSRVAQAPSPCIAR